MLDDEETAETFFALVTSRLSTTYQNTGVGGGNGGGGSGGGMRRRGRRRLKYHCSATSVIITLFNTSAAFACHLPVTSRSIYTSLLLFMLQDVQESEEQFSADDVRTVHQMYDHSVLNFERIHELAKPRWTFYRILKVWSDPSTSPAPTTRLVILFPTLYTYFK
jgi:hypothetical protein